MQLTAGLRAIHQANLACRYFYLKLYNLIGSYLLFFYYFRALDPRKIIVTGKRVRFSFVGISDFVAYDPTQANSLVAISHYQQVWIFIEVLFLEKKKIINIF